MTKIMIASEVKVMTDGQIKNVLGKLRDALRKHRDEFLQAEVQAVLGVENLGMELLAPFRTRVEAASNLIVRRGIKVNRSRTPQEALDATGRRQYIDKDVVKAMPYGEEEEVDFYFFKPRNEAYENGLISNERLAKEYDFFGLVPDPQAQVAVNEADPAFTNNHPNGTYWKIGDKYYYLTFRQWDGGERCVDCGRDDDGWDGGWFFGGVRKSSSEKPLVS